MNKQQIILLLIEELEINLEVVRDYVNYAEANEIEKIDTKKQFTHFKQDNWEKYKGDILFIENGLYAYDIMDIYKKFFMIDNTKGTIMASEPKETLSKINEMLSILKKI